MDYIHRAVEDAPGIYATDPNAAARICADGRLTDQSGRRPATPRTSPPPGPSPGGGEVGRRQAMVQVAPLTVNAVGAAVLPVWVAWNPMVVEPPGARAPL